MSNVSQPTNEPQRKYEYVFPQDANALIKETCTLATIECLQNCQQNIYLVHPQIEERAREVCTQTKEICEYQEVCNDIELFNAVTTKSYIEAYLQVQPIYQENPSMLAQASKELAEFGIEKILLATYGIIDHMITAQQQKEVQ